MSRNAFPTIAFLIVTISTARAAEPTRAAPFYALPPDGAWVEYDWTAAAPGGKEVKGTLRISSVGKKDVEGVTCRWVEVRKEYPHDGKQKKEYRVVLVAEKAFREKPTLAEHVRVVLGTEGDNRAVAPLGDTARRDFLGLGITGPGAALREVEARAKVTVPVGTFVARHVSSRGRRGDRTLEYHGWLTAEVPFGCARFEVREGTGEGPLRTTFTAVVAKRGDGAKGEVDTSKVK
jgi:hypothetical protein